jgi:hypothetical protein
MADTINDGGPVYPCKITPSPEAVRAMREAGNLGLLQARDLAANHTGISLRDAAALAALQGMLAHTTRYRPRPGAPTNWHDAISQEAFQIADAFIAAREAKTDG